METTLRKIFSQILTIPEESITDSLSYQAIKEWDSIAHMQLSNRIEQEFGIMLDTLDIIDMSSFLKSKEILSKYL